MVLQVVQSVYEYLLAFVLALCNINSEVFYYIFLIIQNIYFIILKLFSSILGVLQFFHYILTTILQCLLYVAEAVFACIAYLFVQCFYLLELVEFVFYQIVYTIEYSFQCAVTGLRLGGSKLVEMNETLGFILSAPFIYTLKALDFIGSEFRIFLLWTVEYLKWFFSSIGRSLWLGFLKGIYYLASVPKTIVSTLWSAMTWDVAIACIVLVLAGVLMKRMKSLMSSHKLTFPSVNEFCSRLLLSFKHWRPSFRTRDITQSDGLNLHLCVVCFEKPKNILFLPCKHVCLCGDCFKRLGTTGIRRRRQCPVCRQDIDSFMEDIYLS